MLNATASRQVKDRGLQLSIMFEGEWTVAVLAELRAWLETRRAAGQFTVTFEEFRHDAVSQPTKHFAWGALPRLAQKAGLIEPVLRDDGSQVMRPAKSVRTHGHVVRLWRVASSFSAQPAGEETATLDDADPSLARRHPAAVDGRGGVLQEGAQAMGGAA